LYTELSAFCIQKEIGMAKGRPKTIEDSRIISFRVPNYVYKKVQEIYGGASSAEFRSAIEAGVSVNKNAPDYVNKNEPDRTALEEQNAALQFEIEDLKQRLAETNDTPAQSPWPADLSPRARADIEQLVALGALERLLRMGVEKIKPQTPAPTPTPKPNPSPVPPPDREALGEASSSPAEDDFDAELKRIALSIESEDRRTPREKAECDRILAEIDAMELPDEDAPAIEELNLSN
jgi:hypothetical protein